MNWGSFDAFAAMGGYGLFVWGSYGVTVALLALEVALLAWKRRDTVNRVRAALRAERSAS